MGTRDYARILRRSWTVILVAVVLGVLAGWAVSAAAKPVYSATSAALVTSETGTTFNELTQGNAFTERRVSTYANLVTEPIVTTRVIDDFGLDVSAAQFADDVSVSIPLDTTMLEVTVADTSPYIAAGIANALIASLTAVVAEVETSSVVSGPVGADGVVPPPVQPVKITQVRVADAPESPVSPNVPLNLLIGLFVGLALGTLAAILREVIDTRVRSLEDIEVVTTAPVVGTIPQVAKSRAGAILIDGERGSATAESFRILRTNLQFLDIDGPATFVVTSPGSGEGKSTIAANLGASIAANGVRVLLVEADLRRPQVHRYLDLEGGAGLTDILIGRAEFDDVVQSWASPNLHVLASGRIPPNPSELLGSQHMRELMTQLQGMYDVVLYDTPPVLPVPDAAILSRNVGGVLLVVSIDHTRRDAIRAAIGSLQKVSARISGVVANRVAARGSSGYVTEAYPSMEPEEEPSADDLSQLDPDTTDGVTPDSGFRSMPGGVASEPDEERMVRNSRARSRQSREGGGGETLP